MDTVTTIRLTTLLADHYVEDILEGFKFEKSEPYLLYKNVRDEVRLLLSSICNSCMACTLMDVSIASSAALAATL